MSRKQSFLCPQGRIPARAQLEGIQRALVLLPFLAIFLQAGAARSLQVDLLWWNDAPTGPGCSTADGNMQISGLCAGGDLANPPNTWGPLDVAGYSRTWDLGFGASVGDTRQLDYFATVSNSGLTLWSMSLFYDLEGGDVLTAQAARQYNAGEAVTRRGPRRNGLAVPCQPANSCTRSALAGTAMRAWPPLGAESGAKRFDTGSGPSAVANMGGGGTQANLRSLGTKKSSQTVVIRLGSVVFELNELASTTVQGGFSAGDGFATRPTDNSAGGAIGVTPTFFNAVVLGPEVGACSASADECSRDADCSVAETCNPSTCSCEPAAACGNDVRELPEVCDGNDLGICSVAEHCNASCNGCRLNRFCGDRVLNGSEECDGADALACTRLELCSASCECGPISPGGTIFHQDFESGLGESEHTFGEFAINDTNQNNGSQMMGHPSQYGRDSYSYYELRVDLSHHRDVILRFDFDANIEVRFDGFNVLAGTCPLTPPRDVIEPTAGMFYNFFNTGSGPLGHFAFDSSQEASGTAYFDLSDFEGLSELCIRFQFKSDIDVEYRGIVLDEILITGEPFNRPPDCVDAEADPFLIWPPNRKMVPVEIFGVVDPDGDPFQITVDGIVQNEPVPGWGRRDTSADATIDPLGVRAERAGGGFGRVYLIDFTADDGAGGVCEGTVRVCVPKAGSSEQCDGPLYDSTLP